MRSWSEFWSFHWRVLMHKKRRDWPECDRGIGQFIGSVLPEKGDPLDIVDVGCGGGFIAIELALRGHRVTGIDISPALVEYARMTAHGICGAGMATFHRMDMRRIEFHCEFDACVCWGSWGFFDQEEDNRILCDMTRLVRPGGYLILKYLAWDEFPEHRVEWTWTGDGWERYEAWYEASTRLYCSQTQLYQGGEVIMPRRESCSGYSANECVRCFAPHEIADLLSDKGMTIVSHASSYSCCDIESGGTARFPLDVIVARRL